MGSESLILTGDIVTLRDFTDADCEAFKALTDDHAMFWFMKFRIEAATCDQTADYLLREPGLVYPRRTFNLAAVADGTFVGWAALGGISTAAQAEFGWYFASGAWGRGYATDATSLLLRFGFEALGLRRLIATADPANAASIRVLEKAGLTKEGATEPVETWRGIRPRVLFAVGQEEWRKRAGT
ncbi:MAG: GNAT family N-acetyltransferase [Mycobacteriales bacterium]